MCSKKTFEAEARRVRNGVSPSETTPGLPTFRFVVSCDGNAHAVLASARVLMEAVSSRCAEGWPVADNWVESFPSSFLQACGPELTDAEAEAWLRRWDQLSDADRRAEEAERAWSVQDWLYWVSPENRSWLWWDATAVDPETISVAVVASEWPFPWGALAWLFRGNGAREVAPE